MICKNCGTEVPKHYDRCLYCGEPIAVPEETDCAPEAPRQQVSQQPAPGLSENRRPDLPSSDSHPVDPAGMDPRHTPPRWRKWVPIAVGVIVCASLCAVSVVNTYRSYRQWINMDESIHETSSTEDEVLNITQAE